MIHVSVFLLLCCIQYINVAESYILVTNYPTISSINQAQLYCLTEYGSDLASIHNDDDMTEAMSVCNGAVFCFIGLMRNIVSSIDNTFYWFDGSEWDYGNLQTTWIPGQYPWGFTSIEQPNNAGNAELCVGLHSITTTPYLWADNTCNFDLYPFICNDAPLPTFNPYILVTNHSTVSTISQGQQYCQNEYGSDLASIHNGADMKGAMSICDGQFCFIGLMRNRSSPIYTFHWFDGTEWDYGNLQTTWIPGQYPWGITNEAQPNNYEDGEDCVGLHSITSIPYMWADISCNQFVSYPFICNNNTDTSSPTLNTMPPNTMEPSTITSSPTFNPTAPPNTMTPTTSLPTFNPTSYPHTMAPSTTSLPTFNPTPLPNTMTPSTTLPSSIPTSYEPTTAPQVVTENTVHTIRSDSNESDGNDDVRAVGGTLSTGLWIVIVSVCCVNICVLLMIQKFRKNIRERKNTVDNMVVMSRSEDNVGKGDIEEEIGVDDNDDMIIDDRIENMKVINSIPFEVPEGETKGRTKGTKLKPDEFIVEEDETKGNMKVMDNIDSSVSEGGDGVSVSEGETEGARLDPDEFIVEDDDENIQTKGGSTLY